MATPTQAPERAATCRLHEHAESEFFSAALAELRRARRKFPRAHAGAHEGYAVLLEEVDELWDEVRAQKHDRKLMRKECIQIAAMAARFALEVCE